jgi:hypothetical protein
MQDKTVILNLKTITMLICIVLAKMSDGTKFEYIWAAIAIFYLVKISIFLFKNQTK